MPSPKVSPNRVTRGSGLLEDFLARQRAELANKFIPRDFRKGRILDIGCGTYPLFLASTEFKEKYGVDPVVAPSELRNLDIHLYKLDITSKKLPFKDNFFDVVTMLAVFEHIDGDKLNSVLSDVHRVLKNNGIFIITTPSPWADRLLHFMAKFGVISSEEIHEHKHNHPSERIRDFIFEGGFEKSKIKNGFFEASFNMWFKATK